MSRIPFNKPSIVGKEIENILEAVNGGQLSGDGRFTKECNEMIVRLTGAKAALLTHSCTAALEMAAILCDLAPGDEVIMPSFTFVSTANAVALRGATPVFVDIDPITLNIDPEQAARAITPKTRAIFAVHYAGFMADMDPLIDLARKHDLLIVEDAAQALGSRYKGRLAGSLGDLAAFSFHETKNIISGEGGALTINRPELISRAEIIREKGTDRSKFLRGQIDKYSWVDIGSSFLPGELIAAFLHGQLSQAELINRRRLEKFNRYQSAFSDLDAAGRIRRPRSSNACEGNGHMFYLLLNDMDDRDALIQHLKRYGIIAPFHYVPLHSAPAGMRYGRAFGTLPVTDNISARLIRLPLFLELGNEIETVIAHVTNYLEENR